MSGLAGFHPIVAEWFAARFGTPTEAQEQAFPAIAADRDTLIAAPTGSGKTLAAFLVCLDRLLRRSLCRLLRPSSGSAASAVAPEGDPDDDPGGVEVLYVSPLRALSNDIERNLAHPLAELADLAVARGYARPEIRTAVRTGDTPQSERAKMTRRPPHVLITTPESLYILLTAEKSRAALRTVRTVIVDEIHAVAGTKRGAHLALSLERLEANALARPVRIGLSATQQPIEDVARFLVGSDRVDEAGAPACRIVDAMRERVFDLAVETPEQLELSSIASQEQWAEVYDRVAAEVERHRTTLVFCNTRRHVERAAHALGERLGEEHVAAHHGSLSHKLRRRAEERLKSGELRVVVATASLELGIDVGAVELVVQLGSPRSLSVLVQRIGRSGHVRGGVPKGRLYAMTRDELLECAALSRAVRRGGLDRVRLPEAPLDVLMQQMVAECAARDWDEAGLYALCRRAWPYRDLSRERFDELAAMLSEGVATRVGRATGAHLHHDGVNGRLRGRRGARLAAITSGGAIPDNADYAVVAEPEGVRVGTLDEDFAVESLAGDIFLLGNTSWRIVRVEAGTVRVEDAGGAPPSVPFWNGEAPGRSDEASAALSELRRELQAKLDAGEDPADIAAWLQAECGLAQSGAEQAVAYVDAVRRALGVVPSQQDLVAERFFDEAGGTQLVLHAPFGARINRAWGLALRKRFCRGFNFELQAAATDDGIVLSLAPQHSFPLADVFRFLAPQTLAPLLTQAILQAPMFAVRWRWTATRSLALLRRMGGRRVPPNILRMRADDLLAAVFPHAAACPENLPGGDIEIPRHPLVDETFADCLRDPLDLEGARALLERMEAGAVRLHARDLAQPSPLAHAVLNANPYAYLDDAPLEERRTRAVMMRRTLGSAGGAVGGGGAELGALDAEAIARVVADAWPEVRDADELHDLLLTLGALPEAVRDGEPDLDEAQRAQRQTWFERLRRDGRATRATVRGGDGRTRAFLVATERLGRVRAAWPGCSIDSAVEGDEAGQGGMGEANEDEATARRSLMAARLEFSGPVRADELAEVLALDRDDVELALLALEGEGQILRGQFRPGSSTRGETEWCHRRLLARIHQLTIGRLRREIEPVPASVLVRFLLRWQHVAPGTQLHGAAGLEEVLGQLQGLDAAAGAWERDILPARLGRYEPEWLDLLCLRGEATWGRLDLRVRDSDEESTRRLTRATPIAILRRADLGWLLREGDEARRDARLHLGSVAARVLDHLALAGASFLGDLRRATGYLGTELEEAIGELVASGLVTGDGYSSLRALLDRNGRSGGSGSGRSHGRRRPPRVVPADYRWRHPGERYYLRRAAPGEDVEQANTARASASLGATPGSSSDVSAMAGAGRWSLLLAGPALSPDEHRAAWARQLLRRYGVVFRDLVQRESPLPWRELSLEYRRMEARGELRGGRFVAGFVGEHFALPEVVESLRALRREEPPGEEIVLCATDPLNLVGRILPGPRVPAVRGNRILLRDGVPVASGEGGLLVPREPLDEPARIRAARTLKLASHSTRATR